MAGVGSAHQVGCHTYPARVLPEVYAPLCNSFGGEGLGSTLRGAQGVFLVLCRSDP